MLLQNVEQYVEKLIPKRQELIEEMEAYAEEHHVPIMELIGVETLLQILRLHQPKHILEIEQRLHIRLFESPMRFQRHEWLR